MLIVLLFTPAYHFDLSGILVHLTKSADVPLFWASTNLQYCDTVTRNAADLWYHL